MVEINNQRKAFLDMLAWSEGTDNGRQKTRNHGYDVIVGGELFTDYSDHPRKLVTLNPKLKSTAAGRYQLLSRWWDAYRKQLGLKDFSPKSQDAVALQQIKERGAFKYAAYKVLDDYFTGELQHRNSLSAQLNMKCHEFDQKKDMASFCGQGLAAWRYTKPVLVAEINSLANQLQITIPGLPG